MLVKKGRKKMHELEKLRHRAVRPKDIYMFGACWTTSEIFSELPPGTCRTLEDVMEDEKLAVWDRIWVLGSYLSKEQVTRLLKRWHKQGFCLELDEQKKEIPKFTIYYRAAESIAASLDPDRKLSYSGWGRLVLSGIWGVVQNWRAVEVGRCLGAEWWDTTKEDELLRMMRNYEIYAGLWISSKKGEKVVSIPTWCSWCGLEIKPGQAVHDASPSGVWCSPECASKYRTWYRNLKLKMEEES